MKLFIMGLTVTKVVFEYFKYMMLNIKFYGLTVTKVVFELVKTVRNNVKMKINSNKGCF